MSGIIPIGGVHMQLPPTPEFDEMLRERCANGCVMVAHGVGWNSTAMLIEMHRRGIVPKAVLFADVGAEKIGTYKFVPVFRRWLREKHMPDDTILSLKTVRAPYTTLAGNNIRNGTLPGAAMHKGSCTLKWKVEPQLRWTRRYQPALDAWERGEKVIKLIGFDAGEAYRKNKASDKAHQGQGAKDSARYDNLYPLIEWGIDRAACGRIIKEAGLPVPPKSACYMCPNMKVSEMYDLTPEELSGIILTELSAEPFNRKNQGLWRTIRKRDGRPGSMTEFILREKLPFTPLEDMCKCVVLNPNCNKFETGWSLKPPHLTTSVRELMEDAGHFVPRFSLSGDMDEPGNWQDRHPTYQEDELHRQIVENL